MLNKILLLSAVTLLFSCAQQTPGASTSDTSSETSSTYVSSSSEASSISSEETVSSSESVSSSSSEVISASSMESLSSSESISSSEVTKKRNPMDEPYIGRQYYLNHIGDIYSAWKQYRGAGITIAVIDAGFMPMHEEFYFEDGTSKVSPLSASFTTTGKNTSVDVGVNYTVNMGESHGTFCAGVAAAGINGKGIIGIAPEASLLLLKTDLKPKSIAKAFTYAADHGAKVITISIGSYYDYGGDLVDDGSDLGTVFDAPVKYCYDKGVVVCSAGGNGGLVGMPTEYTFPGCVDHVIGVGGLAANSSSEIWTGSSYNSSSTYQFCDVFAPADGMFGCCHYDDKYYDGEWNGTSFASPIVAGMAALYFEAFPDKTNVDFEKDLYASCHKITTSHIATADQLGYGRVDVGRLLGLERKGSVTVEVDASWDSCSCYAWDSPSGKELSSWPGKTMEKFGRYHIELELSQYDSVIFSNGSEQTVDLSLSSFIYGSVYSLNDAATEQGCFVGTYRTYARVPA